MKSFLFLSLFISASFALAEPSPSFPDAADLFASPGKPQNSFEVGSIAVDQYGTGKKALILIPGLANGPWVWFGTIRALSPEYKLYVLTLPGFDGRKMAPERPLFPKVENDIWTLLAREKLDHPVLIGHSLGGTLAIALGEAHPERLAGIVAVDGLPIFPLLAAAPPAQRAAMAEKMSADYAALSPPQAVAQNEDYMNNIGTNRNEFAHPLALLAAKSNSAAVGAWIKEDLEIMPYNPSVAGSQMSYTEEQTLGFYQMLLAGAPRASVRAISPSRHFVMFDQSAAFEAELRKFLKSLPERE